MDRFAAFFASPARQALAWTALGILGVIFAAVGGWLLLRSDDPRPQALPPDVLTPTPSPVPSPTPTTTPTPSPSPTPSASPSPTAKATPRPGSGTSGGSGSTGAPPPPTPTPTPAPSPAAARDYCPPGAVGPGTLPSGRVAGAVTRGGVPAPAGTVEIVLLFDGVPGPAVLNIDGAFRIDFYAGGESCANRPGAALTVAAEGRVFPTGHTVGDGAQLIPVTVELP